MEAIAIKIPMTWAEREIAPAVLRVEATREEFLELVDLVPYNIDYCKGEIISIEDLEGIDTSMSQATDIHEQLITQIATLLNNLLDDLPDYRVLGSSVRICIQDEEFNADVSVVKGPSEYVTLPSGRVAKSRIKNPEVVVEVLSKSTKAYDQSDKLDEYRRIPSLQHIVFVSQEEVFARVYSRLDQPNEWLDVDYLSLDSILRLGNLQLPLRTIYRKTPLAE